MRSQLKVLTQRDQYRTCHIHIPGEEGRWAAIQVAGRYYSMLRVVKDEESLTKICSRLAEQSRDYWVTRTPKGFVVWVFEPSAGTAETKILAHRNQYRTCHIRIPDEEESLAAIQVEGRYYMLIRVVQDRKSLIKISERLTAQSRDYRVTPNPKGYAIWVLEPEAIPATPRARR
jgi:hypothetical protein